MKSLDMEGDLESRETPEERRAKHEEQRQRMKHRVTDEIYAADRRLLHGAVLAKSKDDGPDYLDSKDDGTGLDDSQVNGIEYKTETFFARKFKRSTPSSREALLKLLARSKKKARVTFDFGLRGMWEDLHSAVTLKRPIKPTSRLRTVWDAIILSLICYGLFMIPFDIAFDVSTYPWVLFEIALDIFFIVDLYMNFLTAYMSGDNELVMDFRKIRNHYLRTWFVIDLIASMPFGIISFAVAQGSESLQVIKLLKAFRLFRMSHLYRAMAGLSTLKGPLLVFLLMIFFGIAAHWFACLFWKLGVSQGIDRSWIAAQESIRDLGSRDQAEQYFASLYWAMATVTTLGYGDITPHTFYEVLYVTFVIFCGAAMYAILISSVSMIVVGRFTAESEYNRHMETLLAFSKLYRLPTDVYRRLAAYYDFIWERRRNFSNQSIMDDLPIELRAVVAGAVHSKMIQHNALLAACDSFGFKHMFAAKISQIVLRLPDEVLHFEGDEVTDIFFVRRGLVDIVVGLDTIDELVVGKRQDGGHCGDIGLFDGGSYATSSVTVHFSEVCSIPAKSMINLLEQFPREKALFVAVAKARAASIERLLTEFDELAAGKQAGDTSLNPPEFESTDPLTTAGERIKQQSKKLITRLLGHQTDDSDYEFFWKLWETAVSPETDEQLVEQTVKMLAVLPEEASEQHGSMKSKESAEVIPSSPRGSPKDDSSNPFNIFSAEPVSVAGAPLGRVGSSRRLRTFISDAHGSQPRRSSEESNIVRNTVVSPRGRSNDDISLDVFAVPGARSGGVDSISRELGAIMMGPKRASIGAQDEGTDGSHHRSMNELILAKLEDISSRLEMLEINERKGRRRGESSTLGVSFS